MSIEQNRLNVARFNRWARIYNQGRLSPWLVKGQSKALNALRLRPSDWLLDVGCGTGWAVIEAARRLTEGGACGIDLSPGMIERAMTMANGLSNVEFRTADAEAIPYPSERFSAVICTHSFHHYSNPRQALSEMHRVLKPGGRLVVLDSDRAGCLWVRFWDLVLRIFEKGHVRYYTEYELMQLLTDFGFGSTVAVNFDHGHFRFGKIGWALTLIRADKQS